MKRGAPEDRPGRLYLSSVFERAKELNLAPSKRLVLVSLFRYLGDKDYCFPSQQGIAEDTGLTERTVRTLLKELAKNGVIEITTRQTTRRKHGNHTYEYRLKIPHNENQTGNLKQNQTGNLRQSNRKSTATKAEIQDSQTGNLRHSKVPEKQASHGRAGAESVKGIGQRNRSVNQSGTDGLTTNTKISLQEKNSKKTASEEVDPLADNEEAVLDMKPENENFVPPPGAPSRLSPEQVKAIFRGPGPRPVDILDCPEGEFDLSRLVAPFKGLAEVFEIIRFNPGISQVEWFEKTLKEFYRKVIDRHWSKKASPPGTPFRNLFFKAGRSGLLYEYGFRPLSPEQVEAQRLEQERQEAQEQEDTRLREEERRRLAERDAALKEFIKRPTVRDYLDFKGVPRKLGAIREHLREIAARLNGLATPQTAVEEFMRKELQNEGY